MTSLTPAPQPTSGVGTSAPAAVPCAAADAALPFKGSDEALVNAAGEVSRDDRSLVNAIVQLVQQSTQVDLSHYKDTTFRRQLDRRIRELGLGSLAQYFETLKLHPEELQRLQQSLLISVTSFFRDPDVFARLKEVLAEWVATRPEGEGLRLWVPGCATGEEAYTLAMVVAEVLGDRLARWPVRLFATDIDQAAIKQARVGQYGLAAVAHLPADLLARYFVQDDAGVRPIKAIRDLCVFAHHDLLVQPPFVNIDVVSCRNVLIYFQAEMQAEILAKFHHALRPGGCMVLGQSESVGAHDGYYEVIDARQKIFRRTPGRSPRMQGLVMQWAGQGRGRDMAPVQLPLPPSSQAAFHAHLLTRYAPPSVLVDARGRVLQFWGDINRYLRLPDGRADFSITGLCLPALRSELKTLLHLTSGSVAPEILSQPVVLGASEPREVVRMASRMMRPDGGEPGGVVLSFEERMVPEARTPLALPDGLDVAVATELQELREELALSREHLHTMVEQLESANEELLSLNEELQASSEELQSSNEELQASNEEITTVNEQLQSKTAELTALNDMLLSIESSVQMALVVVDQQLRVQRFNALAVRIFGLLEHDIGRSLSSVPSSLPLQDLPAQIDEVLSTGQAMVRRIDHGDRHYMLQISPHRDARLQSPGVILAFTDVAELRQAEVERSRLAAIVTSSDDAIVSKTLEGVVTSWNPGAERLFGYTSEEALGQPMLFVFPPERREEEAMLLERLVKGETVPPFDTVRMRKDGLRIHVSVSLSPIRDGTGRLVGISKIARDIGDRRRDEAARQAYHERLEDLVDRRTEALAEKERHLQTILDGVPGMVAYWDTNLRLRYANRLHREYFDRDQRGVLGRHMSELLGEGPFAAVLPKVEAALRGEAQLFESGEPRPTGDSRQIAQVYFAPDQAQGVVLGFIVMVFDITSIKQAEAAAEAASRAKSDFLASMSHEIRTPLNAVLGLTQVGARQYQGDPVAETFEHIMQAGQHLLGIINDVLDFSKIEAGKLKLQRGRVVVADLIEQGLGMVRDLARDKAVSLRVECDPELPDVMEGDPLRTAQLLINLLTNAVKFTERGEVSLSLSVANEGVSMTVTDTGPGMAPDMLARLFRPFEQGDGSTTRRVGGTGLGLSICKRLVELMQGTIDVDSTAGQGSRFEVWLPLKAVPSRRRGSDSRPMPLTDFGGLGASPGGVLGGGLGRSTDVVPGHVVEADGNAPPGRLSGLRILVAEDHPVNQMVLQQILSAEGASMVCVTDGLQAVEQVEARGPDAFDLVLCDIEMPVMDGYEATRRIVSLVPTLPVIGLTAHAFEDARRRGEEAGMRGYLTKPYMVEELVAEILRQVAVRRANASRGGRLSVVLDRQALEAHYSSLPGFIDRLMLLVRQSCESQPALLREAFAQGDAKRVRYLAHEVANIAANLLMPDLRAASHRLEQVAIDDLGAAGPLVDDLVGGLESLLAQLDAG